MKKISRHLPMVTICGSLLTIMMTSFNPCLGQKVLTTNEWLNKTSTTAGSNEFNNLMKEYTTHPLHIPIIDKIELRTETQDFDIDQQELLFRVSFNDPAENRRMKQLNSLSIDKLKLENEIVYFNALVDNYYILQQIHYQQETRSLSEDLLIVTKDKQAIYQKMLTSGMKVDIDEFVKLSNDLYELELEKLKAHQEIRLAGLTTSDLTDKEIFVIDPQHWVSIQKMTEVIQSLPERSVHPAIQMRSLEVAIADAETRLEFAEQKNIYDYAQVRYSPGKDDPFKEVVSIGIGFQIPVKRLYQYELSELQRNRMKQQYYLSGLQYEKDQHLRLEVNAFLAHFEQYNLLLEHIEESDLDGMLEKYSDTPVADPLQILQLKEQIIRQKQMKIESENELTNRYIKILEVSGALWKKRGTNFLHNDLIKL